MLEAETLLGWWLVDVLEYTPLFFRLIIVTTMFDAISNPYGKAIHATGRIRNYQLVCSSILIAIVPIAYIVLKLGGAPYSVFVVHIVLGFIAMIFRILISEKNAGIPSMTFLSQSAPRLLMVTLFSIVAPLLVHYVLPAGFLRFMSVGFISVCFVCLCVFLFGITQNERQLVLSKIKNIKK
jgi:hypothetical protein